MIKSYLSDKVGHCGGIRRNTMNSSMHAKDLFVYFTHHNSGRRMHESFVSRAVNQ